MKLFNNKVLTPNLITYICSYNYSTRINENVRANFEKRKAEMLARGLPKVKPIPNVNDIILVSSGKGGVGKSTTSVNLAVALKLQYPEKNVGLLDADVFGPSIPLMMNLDDSPLLTDKNLMVPLVNYDVKCMSMGFLIGEGSALVWRGLMVMQALEKLMRQVDWGPIDYLIVDTPPGTGDTHLSLVQNLPITGALLVTTPQAAAINVTKRGATMFEKLKVPVIGIIENMSSVKCPKCLSDVPLFGSNTEKLAIEINSKVVTKIPLEKFVSESGDNGVPIVIAKPDCDESKSYKNLAKFVKEFVEISDRKCFEQ